VEIYVDGELIKTAHYQENPPDPAFKASWSAAVIATKDLSPGAHTARVVVTNWYGKEIVKEQEFVICEGLSDVIPASQTNKVSMLASAPVQIQGYAPDCTASMEVTWSATAMQESGITLRAAWLRINGQVVASSKPPGATAPPSGYNFDLPAVSTEGSGDGTTLGGLYAGAVEPGTTVTVDIVVFGSDCRYYMAAWEKYVPGCPVPYTPPPTPPCFSADTLVVASDGSLVRIDEIQVGDMVKAYNTDSGEIVVREVTAINSGQADYYYTINGNLKVTPPHPFYLVEEGWVPVENLKVGDRIRSIDGETVITSIELVYEEQSIFNIGVTGGNFFVSPDGLEFYLVHQGE